MEQRNLGMLPEDSTVEHGLPLHKLGTLSASASWKLRRRRREAQKQQALREALDALEQGRQRADKAVAEVVGLRAQLCCAEEEISTLQQQLALERIQLGAVKRQAAAAEAWAQHERELAQSAQAAARHLEQQLAALRQTLASLAQRDGGSSGSSADEVRRRKRFEARARCCSGRARAALKHEHAPKCPGCGPAPPAGGGRTAAVLMGCVPAQTLLMRCIQAQGGQLATAACARPSRVGPARAVQRAPVLPAGRSAPAFGLQAPICRMRGSDAAAETAYITCFARFVKSHLVQCTARTEASTKENALPHSV
ncbi:hypothetical protein ABPG77_008809 [Micractinium sp. CCAP 211/92]